MGSAVLAGVWRAGRFCRRSWYTYRVPTSCSLELRPDTEAPADHREDKPYRWDRMYRERAMKTAGHTATTGPLACNPVPTQLESETPYPQRFAANIQSLTRDGSVICCSSWRWLAFLCLAAAAVVLAGCPSQTGTSTSGKKRIVFLTNGSDPFWDACRSGLEEGAKQFEIDKAGYTVAMEVNNGKPQGQIDKLRQFASQGDVAAVAISVIQADNAAIIEEMKKLQAKGIKVITVDGDVNRDKFR